MNALRWLLALTAWMVLAACPARPEPDDDDTSDDDDSGDDDDSADDDDASADDDDASADDDDATADDDDSTPSDDDDSTPSDDDDATNPPNNLVCSNLASVDCGAFAGSNIGQPDNEQEWLACVNYGAGYTGGETIYEFIPSSSEVVTIDLDWVDSAVDLDLFVFTDCNPGSTCLDESSTETVGESVAFTAINGASFYLVVDGWDGSEGQFTITLDATCPGDDDDATADDDDATADDDDATGDDDDSTPGYDGPGWEIVHSRNQPRLQDVHGHAADAVWGADTDGLLWLWDGSRWTLHDDVTRNIQAFWGSAESDIWGFSYSGAVYHWDGVDWSGPDPIGAVTAHWKDACGSSASDIWAVGYDGAFAHYDGASWTELPGPNATEDLVTVACMANGQLWAGAGSNSWLYNSGTWLQYQGSPDEFREFWVSPSDELFGATQYSLYRYENGAFVNEAYVGETITELWGFSAGDLYASAYDGELWHRNGSGSWSDVSPNVASSTDWRDVFGVSPTEVWAVAANSSSSSYAGIINHGSPGNFEDVRDTPVLGDVAEMTGWSDSAIWAVTDASEVLFYDGVSWEWEATVGATRGLFACSATEVWGISTTIDTVFRRTGPGTWVPVSTGQSGYSSHDEIDAVWGSSCSDIWFIGNDYSNETVLLHWDGATFTREYFFNFPNGAEVHRLWGSASDDIWGLTDDYRMVHYDGAVWTDYYDGNFTCCGGVWGSGSDDIWAIENNPSPARYYDGATWTSFSDFVYDPAYGTSGISISQVWGRATDDIWMIGQDYDIIRSFHYDGSQWLEAPSPSNSSRSTDSVDSLWGSAAGYWAGGQEGLILFHP